MNAPAAESLVIQLRVLAGLHEGAVLAWRSDQSRLQLGPSGQVDVLLRDAPGLAELISDEGAWFWQEPGFDQPLQVGQSWRWGKLVLSLASASQPWPEEMPALAFDRQPGRAPEVAPEPVIEVADAAGAGSEAAAKSPSQEAPAGDEPNSEPLDPPVARGKAAGGSRMGAGRLAVVLALALVLILALLWGLAGQTKPANDVAAPPVSEPIVPVNLAQVKKALLDLGLASQVRPELRADGRLLLTGVVADDEQLEALMRAITPITRRVSPRVITQTEFVARARALQPNLPEGIEASPQEGGQLLLLAKQQEVDWVVARQLVDSELPEAVSVDHRSPAPPAPVQAARPAAPVAPATPLGSPNPPAAPATVATPAAPPPEPPFPALPAVSAVMGGPRPYLLLASGDKWLPGGKIGGVVLQSIQDDAVVFDDGQGRTLRKPR